MPLKLLTTMRILLSVGGLLTPFLLNSQSVSVALTLKPEVIMEGKWTMVRVAVTDEEDRPIAGASVTLEAGGGLFATTGKSFTAGVTDAAGVFQAEWSCDDCAPTYQLIARGKAAGSPRITVRADIHIRDAGTAAAPAIASGIAPAAVEPGEAATISIAAFRGATPATGVEVKIGVGGGRFHADTVRLPNLAIGRTDSSGYYRVAWSCDPCAANYEFTVLAAAATEPQRIVLPLAIGQPPPARKGPLSAVAGTLRGCRNCADYQVTAFRPDDDSFQRSVRVDPSCQYELNLLPGLYRVELEQRPPATSKTEDPEVYQVQVNPRMMTTVDFRCE